MTMRVVTHAARLYSSAKSIETLLGGKIMKRTAISAVAWSANRLDIFGLGTDSQLFHKAWDGAWKPSPVLWEPQGGICTSAPAAVSWGVNRIDIFLRGADKQMYHKAFDSSRHDWEPMGGVFASSPAAVCWGPNRLDIFAIGTDGNMYHKAWDGAAWRPSPTDWAALGGGPFIQPPCVVSWGANRLDVFAVRSDGQACHNWYEGAWGGWEALGGNFVSPLGVASPGDHLIDLFGVGIDWQVMHQSYNGGWKGWLPMGQVFSSPVSAVSWAKGRLDIFGVGRDNQMWHNWSEGAWGGWEALGGVFASAPAVASWAPHRLDVFALGQDDQMWHKAQAPGVAGWYPSPTDWEPLGGTFALPRTRLQITAPHVDGQIRFAVIICSFNDLPPLSIPNSLFTDFVDGPGKGGVFDFYSDVSYGSLDLTGSDVFGPYTMQYSYVQAGNQGREVWINEARRLAAAAGVDLSPYYGVIAVVNANPDDSNDGGRNLALGISQWGQDNWRWCDQCQGLWYAGLSDTGKCPATGSPAAGGHQNNNSYDYRLAMNMPKFQGQDKWRWCRKCYGLVYSGNPSPGRCPADTGMHDTSTSNDYTLAFGTVDFPGQNNWKRCNKCQWLTYAGNPAPGNCPAGGSHQHDPSGANYTLSAPIFGYDSHFSLSFTGHEMGHSFGLQHAHCLGVNPPAPNWDYCDPWDIMGAGTGVYNDPTSKFAPVGPGFNAGNLSRFGWIPQNRILSISASGTATQEVQLTSLSRTEVSGNLMLRVLASDCIYTFEYRQRDRWDRGLSTDAVVGHEFKSVYTLGENNWRWCNKCQGLAFADLTPGPCPAGGVHDHTGSGDYSVLPQVAGIAGSSNWRWCCKCQQLAYATAGAGACAGGGGHDFSRSINYSMLADGTAFAGQNDWKYCRKCFCLVYAGASTPGNCPASGLHDTSGSANYTLSEFVSSEPFLIGSWQAGQKWIDLEKGITMVVNAIDTGAFKGTVTVTV
jgi:hypothetical protein